MRRGILYHGEQARLTSVHMVSSGETTLMGHDCRHPQPPIRWSVGLAHSLRPRQSGLPCNKPDAGMDGAWDVLSNSVVIFIRLDGFNDQIPALPHRLANGPSLFNFVYSSRHW